MQVRHNGCFLLFRSLFIFGLFLTLFFFYCFSFDSDINESFLTSEDRAIRSLGVSPPSGWRWMESQESEVGVSGRGLCRFWPQKLMLTSASAASRSWYSMHGFSSMVVTSRPSIRSTWGASGGQEVSRQEINGAKGWTRGQVKQQQAHFYYSHKDNAAHGNIFRKNNVPKNTVRHSFIFWSRFDPGSGELAANRY